MPGGRPTSPREEMYVGCSGGHSALAGPAGQQG